VAPWLVGFFVLTAYPFFASLAYSFTDFDMFTQRFVGLRNYARILTEDRIFAGSLRLTLLYTAAAVPAKLAVALALALLLNKAVRGIGVFRTLYFLPSILGASIALSILWRYLFKSDGLVNMFLALFRAAPVNWLGSPDTALLTLVVLPLWQMGTPMVIFLAALKTIPRDLVEAARIDGAGRVRIFFRITLPMITSVIFFNLIMQTIELIQLFTPAYVITQGGPIKATYLYALMLYDVAFRDFKMGYASALSWILFTIIITYTIVLFRSSRRWVFYEDEA
jgi:oligogalacturonide transport system permease protein